MKENLRVVVLKDTGDVLYHWPFFKKALDDLNNPKRANLRMTSDAFFRVALHCLDNGVIATVIDDDNNLRAFGFAYDNTSPWENILSVHIFVAYSFTNNHNDIKYLMCWFEKEAKALGFKRITAWASRINTAAFRWFEKKYNFYRKGIVFCKEI